MKKQTVSFAEVKALLDTPAGQVAVLREITHHPLLGNSPMVCTSPIVRMEVDEGVINQIETRSTIYVREEIRGDS